MTNIIEEFMAVLNHQQEKNTSKIGLFEFDALLKAQTFQEESSDFQKCFSSCTFTHIYISISLEIYDNENMEPSFVILKH